MLVLRRVITSLLLTCCIVSTSFAQFQFVSERDLPSFAQGNHNNLIFNGENWLITQGFTTNTIIYDPELETVVGNVLIPFFGQDVIDAQAIAYVPETDLYYISDDTSGLVRELAFPDDVEMPITSENPVLDAEFDLLAVFSTFASEFTSIAPISGTNTRGLAYDEETDTFWSINFDGRVDQRRRQDDTNGNFSQGDLVSSFLITDFPAEVGTPDGIAGMTLDPVNRSLFVVTFMPAAVVEYELDGTMIGTALDMEQTVGEPRGFIKTPSGVAYDPALGRLRILIDFGIVLTYDDPSRASALIGDVNLDALVNFLDIGPFINLLSTNQFQAEGDVNGDSAVTFADIAGFIGLLSSN